MAVDVIVEARAKIEQRLKELAEESKGLHRALEGLQGETRTQSATPPPARRRRRKRARPGQRRQQFLGAVSGQPGINVSEIAKKIGTVPNPLYALARKLIKEKEIEKDGSGYRIAKATPKGSTAPRKTARSKKKTGVIKASKSPKP